MVKIKKGITKKEWKNIPMKISQDKDVSVKEMTTYLKSNITGTMELMANEIKDLKTKVDNLETYVKINVGSSQRKISYCG